MTGVCHHAGLVQCQASSLQMELTHCVDNKTEVQGNSPGLADEGGHMGAHRHLCSTLQSRGKKPEMSPTPSWASTCFLQLWH